MTGGVRDGDDDPGEDSVREVRADVIGSLLRPPALLAAREALAEGRLSPARFKEIEDRAVDAAVALQEEAGLDAVTDGEMRRLSFQSQMTEAVEGFGPAGLDAFLWGEWRGEEDTVDRPRPPDLGITGRLRRRRALAVEEFVYLRARTTRLAKVTLPSPGLFANFYEPDRADGVYPTLESFLADVVAILREEVAELARLGARYVQIDAPHYTLLLDPATRAFYESRGWSVEAWLDRGVALDNAVMEDFPGITFGVHLCRGNQGSRWLVEGEYGPLARTLFPGLRAERLLLEYDDPRAGSFAALRHVPEDKTVVLGLVSTKRGALESADDLARRIEEAARYVPLDRLAVSPQCGFATSIIGNDITEAEQRAKLGLVARLARRIWG